MRKGQATWSNALNRWKITVQVKGVSRSFYSPITGTRGKIEAEAKADAWLEEVASGVSPVLKKNSSMLVKDLFNGFIQEKKSFNEHYQQFQSIGNRRIIPVIGNIEIRDLTEQDCQNVIHEANADGLSKKTQQNIRACLTSFLKYCRKRGCTTLHLEELKVHKDAPEYEKKVLKPSDTQCLFSSETTMLNGEVSRDRYSNLYRFGVLTGLRTGELIGLQWSDIKDGYVEINRSVNRYGDITKGKNKNALRRFKLIPAAVSVLNDQRSFLDGEGNDSEWVFPAESKTCSKTEELERAWRRYCKYNGIEYLSLYEMSRHTFVSLNKEMPVELLKRIAGHSDSMDTMKVYGHLVDGELDLAASLIEKTMDKYLK